MSYSIEAQAYAWSWLVQRQSFGTHKYTNNNADLQLHSVVMFTPSHTVQPQTLNHWYIPLSFVPNLCTIKGHFKNGQ